MRPASPSWPRAGGSTRGRCPLPPAATEPQPESPAEHYLAAQRLLARGEETSGVLALLEKALARHPGADAALALAEKLVARVATPEESSRRRLDLLRAAHADEYEPARRARLGWRLAAQLEAVGESSERSRCSSARWKSRRRARACACAASGRACSDRSDVRASSPPRWRRMRVRCSGDARLPVLAEQAELLEAAGEAERALDVRLMALAEFPGAPAVLDDARTRLEATGRPIESLALAIAALDHTTDRTRRLALLRDVAVLSEQPEVNANPGDAANAWLAGARARRRPTRRRPPPRSACCARSATGNGAPSCSPGRWRAPPPATPEATEEGDRPGWVDLAPRRTAPRTSRRGRRSVAALRSDRALGAPLPALADPPELASLARRDFALAVETARAGVAPNAAERSRGAGRSGRAARSRAGAAATPNATRSRRSISIRATPTRSRRSRRCTKGSAGPASSPTSWGGARRACRRARRRRCTSAAGAPRSALAIAAAAREAYRKAMSLDPTLAEPVAALGALAAREGDWSEVAKLLESEVGLATSATRKGPLLIELAVVHGDRLADPARAVTLLESAARFLPDDPRLLDLGARFQLAAGNWQAAADALDRLAARGAAIADAAERYFAVGAAAEAAGQNDRALTLYSRSYGRDSGYRPTLERLSAICFERGQWDNAWKATEALLERHGSALAPGDRATLLARSAIADLHIGQRAAAVARLKTIVTRGASYVPDAGIRDVADSWAGMHIEPRLLDRRRSAPARARSRTRLARCWRWPRTSAIRCAGRRWRSSARSPIAEGRWSEALATLEVLSADTAFDDERRSDFLVAAGDILVQQYGDTMSARALFDRARALWPGNPSLWHVAESSEV